MTREAAARTSPAEQTLEVLLRIHREVLDTDRVRDTDNFFDLGGNSLLAIQLTRRVRAELGVRLPVKTVFAAGSVRELAAAVGAALPSEGAPA